VQCGALCGNFHGDLNLIFVAYQAVELAARYRGSALGLVLGGADADSPDRDF